MARATLAEVLGVAGEPIVIAPDPLLTLPVEVPLLEPAPWGATPWPLRKKPRPMCFGNARRHWVARGFHGSMSSRCSSDEAADGIGKATEKLVLGGPMA